MITTSKAPDDLTAHGAGPRSRAGALPRRWSTRPVEYRSDKTPTGKLLQTSAGSARTAPRSSATHAAAETEKSVRPANVFRQHHLVRPTRLSKIPALRDLVEEWVAVNSDPVSSSKVAGWGLQHPQLSGHLSPGDLVDAIDDANADTSDDMLRCLALMAQDGDPLAFRVLLQAMLPGIYRLERRCTIADNTKDGRYAELLFAFHEAAHRVRPNTNRVAATLLLNTLHRVTYHLRRGSDMWHHAERAGLDESFAEADAVLAAEDHYPTAVYDSGSTAPYEAEDALDLVELLAWARRTDAIASSDIEVLELLYTDGNPDWDQTAHKLGCSRKTLNQRHHRAKHRLAAAVLADLQARDSFAQAS